MKDLDALVFDIQDIGARFYTFISTMGEAMDACAEAGVPFVVLDRPNPINGVDVEGPMLDPGSESFVAYHRLPVRHGMTVGELAELIRAERQLKMDLKVIPVEGWRRSEYWDATGLVWVNPSPNMRSLAEAVLYPGVGLLETTNVSVGRGTDTPFEVLGAPWIDAIELAAELNQAHLPGVSFVPVKFTPDASKFANEACGGVNIVITDRAAIAPVDVGLQIACALRKLYPDQWESKRFNRLLGNAAILAAIQAGRSAESLRELYEPELEEFREHRQQYLLYGN